MSARIVLKRRGAQEGESPFWISFADLMSALMTLFLVVMMVTLIAVTKSVSIEEEGKIQRETEVREIMSRIRDTSRVFPEVTVNESAFRIDLGEIARFESGKHEISNVGARFLRSYIPVLLQAQATQTGRRRIRHIVVEGFTDQDGTYLYNLDLSLNRSRSVLCVLFGKPGADETPLSEQQKRQIRDLFLVGGYSFNAARAKKEESRRVELRLEFWAPNDARAESQLIENKDFGQCRQ